MVRDTCVTKIIKAYPTLTCNLEVFSFCESQYCIVYFYVSNVETWVTWNQIEATKWVSRPTYCTVLPSFAFQTHCKLTLIMKGLHSCKIGLNNILFFQYNLTSDSIYGVL